MNVIIISKRAFDEHDGTPLVVAGHTSQLVRPVIQQFLAIGVGVAYVRPDDVLPEDSCVYDPGDSLPDGLIVEGFRDLRPAKSPLSVGWLSLKAAVRRAAARLGSVDALILCNCFPLAIPVGQVAGELGIPWLALLRGGDGYKWPDSEWVARNYGSDAGFWITEEYHRALSTAHTILAASDWLARRFGQLTGRIAGVFPSPGGTGTAAGVSKLDFAHRTLDCDKVGEFDFDASWLLAGGRASPDKRLDLAPRIYQAASMSGWQLVLASVGDVEFSLTDCGAKLLANGRMVVVSLPPRLMSLAYGVAQAYLHTSIPSDTFIDSRPSMVTGAAFNGLPIVAPLSSRGGLVESLDMAASASLLYEVDDVEEEAVVKRSSQALRRLQSERIREHVGAANRRHASAYSNEKMAEELLRMIQNSTKVGYELDKRGLT